MKLQNNLRHCSKQNWKWVSPAGWKLLKVWKSCPSTCPPQLKLPKGKSSLSFLHTKWKLQSRKNLVCHVILSKSRNSIPKGWDSIMALNKMPQLLNQHCLVCTGLWLNRNSVCHQIHIFSEVQKGKSSGSFTPAVLIMYTQNHSCQVETCAALKVITFIKSKHLLFCSHHYCPFHETNVSLCTGVSQTLSPTNVIPFDFSILERKIFPTPSVLSFLLIS